LGRFKRVGYWFFGPFLPPFFGGPSFLGKSKGALLGRVSPPFYERGAFWGRVEEFFFLSPG